MSSVALDFQILSDLQRTLLEKLNCGSIASGADTPSIPQKNSLSPKAELRSAVAAIAGTHQTPFEEARQRIFISLRDTVLLTLPDLSKSNLYRGIIDTNARIKNRDVVEQAMGELDWSDTTGREDVRVGERAFEACLAQCINQLCSIDWRNGNMQAVQVPDDVERLLERAWRAGRDIGTCPGWPAVRLIANGPANDQYVIGAKDALLCLHKSRGEAMRIIEEFSHIAKPEAEFADKAIRRMKEASGERASSLLTSWKLCERKKQHLRIWESHPSSAGPALTSKKLSHARPSSSPLQYLSSSS
jgi:hypothetical protein